MLSNQTDGDANPVLLPHSILIDAARAEQLRETTSPHGGRRDNAQ